MRAVIDTNVILSGLLWHGAPHTLLEAVRNTTLGLVSSPALLDELARVISRDKFAATLSRSQTSGELLLIEVQHLAELVSPPPLLQPVCRDPDDDAVLALAIAARVDLIISGDEDLLAVGNFQGIPIVNPIQTLNQITTS